MIDVIDTRQFTSYTNKDFESIYTELLDLVPELTYKWDPSSSNESDPGVILLKLLCIIADKCNYNIDQNVLECFPLSVTQDSNARQLFEQLGYFMPWYRSAVTNISLKWIGDESLAEYTIPKFTMVSDYETSIVYTLVGAYDGTVDDHFDVCSQKLKCNGDILTFKAIQGIAVNYDINGQVLITPDLLDSNNRLYFDGTDIAENGIFITNSGKNNYREWQRKDNLLVESLGNKFYRFGVSKDMDSCYLEFPEDVNELFGEGVNITYIQTDGEYGNVSSQIIERFYDDLTPEESTTDNPVVLTQSNVQISNTASATNGAEPQDVNSAYRGYKRTIGTFDTLITLRDYINAVINSGLVSNGFACDRENDIQSTYKVMSNINDTNQQLTVVEKDFSDKPVLTAFSLKFYLLRYVDVISTAEDYNKTFELINNNELLNVKAYISSTKSLSHDYVDIQPATNKAAHFCYFKNKYPIDCNILTQYPLSIPEAEEVVANIKQALYDNLNSKEIDFGDEVTLDLVYDIVVGADERIKAANIDNLVFTTHAVYFDGEGYKEVEISSDDIDPVDLTVTYNLPVYEPYVSYNKGTYIMHDGHRYRCVEHVNKVDPWIESKWELDEIKISSNETTFTHKLGIGNYEQQVFVYKESQWTLNNEVVSLDEYGITVEGYLEEGDILKANISVKTQLRDEIYAKSVLAGTTQFFVKSEPFNYNLNQKITQHIDGIEKISSNVDIIFRQGIDSLADVVEYKLKSNENLQFYAPNLIDGTSYSNYVKYEYAIGSDIASNSEYQLKDNEYIIFYWKEEANNLALYKYACYGKGNIFKPSFELVAKSGSLIGEELKLKCRNIGTDTDPVLFCNTDKDGDMSADLSDKISGLVDSKNILSGTRTLTRREMNKVTLDSSYFCYWILNETTNGKYRLFESNPDDPTAKQSTILKTGEYFFYSSSALTDLIILGSGTEISRSNSANNWDVEVSPANTVLSEGTNALKDLWMKIPSDTTVDVVENQYLTVGPGCTVKIEVANPSSVCTLSISDNAVIDKNVWFGSDLGQEQVNKQNIYNFIYTNYSWTYQGSSILLSNYGITYNTEPVEGDVITVTVSASWQLKIDNKGVVSDKSLSDFRISYRTSDSSSEYQQLEDISLVSHDGWRIMSLLSLSMSSTDTQRLLENQSITYYTKDSNTGVTITGKSLSDNSYPVALLSSMPVDLDGSGIFSTSYVDDYGQTIYLSLYEFEEMLSDNTNGIRFYGDNNTIFDFLAGQTEKSISFSIPRGEYILKVSNSSSALDLLTLTLDGNLLYSMYDTGLTNFRNRGNHYLYMNITDETTHQLVVNISEHNEPYTVSITNCYRYNRPEGMSEEYFKKIYTLLNNLDSEKHSFDYTLEISEDDNIENPLAAKSFFKSNHIYNKFTICQLDTSKNSKIYVTGKK